MRALKACGSVVRISPTAIDDVEMGREEVLSSSAGEVFDDAPRILQEVLLFPYLDGFAFLKALPPEVVGPQ